MDAEARWLAAWHFDVPYADQPDVLNSVRNSLEIDIDSAPDFTGAAVLRWDPQEQRPRLEPLTSANRLDPGLFQLIFAATFLIPLLHAATASPPQDQASSLEAIGIDHRFQHQLQEHLVPGTWAVLMIATLDQLDKATDENHLGRPSGKALQMLPPSRLKGMKLAYGPTEPCAWGH